MWKMCLLNACRIFSHFRLIRPSATRAVFLSYAGAGLIDLTNPSARDWLKGLIVRNVLAYGVSGASCDDGSDASAKL
jgi:hypothetical protein